MNQDYVAAKRIQLNSVAKHGGQPFFNLQPQVQVAHNNLIEDFENWT